MSKFLTGSLCLSDINAKAKEGHSAFSRADNGKIYLNIKLWLNDEPDKYGHTASLQLNSTKEKRESEGNVYIGNAKPAETKPIAGNATDVPADDDLPF